MDAPIQKGAIVSDNSSSFGGEIASTFGGGAPASPDFGLASRAFNGSSAKVAIANTLTADITGDNITIAMWMKPDGTAFSSTDSGIVSNIYPSKVMFNLQGYSAGASNKRVSAAIFNGGGWNYAEMAADLTFGVWTHIMGTYDGANIKIYVGGVLSATTAYATGLPSTTTGWTIGNGIQASSTKWYDGKLADVRVYNSALVAANAVTLMAGTDITENLVGHYFVNTDDVDDHSVEGSDGTNTDSTFSVDGPLD